MIQNSNFLTALQLQEQYKLDAHRLANETGQTADGLSFSDILKQKQEGVTGSLKFSKHASIRLEQRGISLTDGQVKRLEDGTIRASMKGIKDSLVIVDDMAFIVNVPNQTVVTAMDSKNTAENIFTNIDGAVFV